MITDRMWARLLSSTNQPSFPDPKDIVQDEDDEETLVQGRDGENQARCDNGLVKSIPTRV